ncbi:hypothetical protein IMCC13023_01660 [Candidatus Aquiluna sp. IMCC13023]|uniref:hypothetical protein n=1 Tax=Candidatus Aquiluna sp. IMCC13023 TaxID=1081644 RepID=UPI00025B11E1|nr:hypothetical protein [Candidatus Aquiluna sp. IMCC13023]EIC92425.1 hypothetical protein IMCC13023_01660 [Candidatus Aquiluna sp. IMCC13023]
MNHQEKTVWAELFANFAVLIGYSAWLLGQLAQKDVSEIEYGWVLVSVFLLNILFSIVTQIVLVVSAHVAPVIAAHVGPVIAERTGRPMPLEVPAVQNDTRSPGLVDVRDKDIRSRSNTTGMNIMSLVALAALALAAFEVGFFEIAHVLFFGGLMASVAMNIAKIWFYRKGV